MDRLPNRTALREARRLQKLGDIAPVCAFCGYEGFVISVTVRWLKARGVPRKILNKLLEDHHPHGSKHDPDLTIPLCRNSHAECTEGVRREGVSMRFEPNPRERIARTLEAQAAFFENLAEAQRRLAGRVRALP
jgi:hypothetical protein